MLDEILAKSKPCKESLIAHTENVLTVWQELKKRYEAVLNNDADFWRMSFLSALFHDFGKVAMNFQLVIQNKKKYKREEYIRHEFLSGLLLLYSDVKDYQQSPLSLFAVFSHHKPLTDSLFQDENCFAEILLQKDWVEFIYKDFTQKMIENGIEKFNPSFDLLTVFLKRASKGSDGKNLYYDSFYKFFSIYKQRTDISQKDRKEYILYKALLNIADWTASGHSSLTETYSYTIDTLKIQIIDKLKNEGKERIAQDFKFRKFQLESKIQGSVLAIAPTGSGKTEASLIWASQKSAQSKILYLLPTRVTSNAIYQRITSYFGKSNTAVAHSSALLYRKEIEDNSYEKIEYLKDKTFFKNITICTIDQVLTQGFNLGYWEIKTFHLYNARIIIDEIHLYQPFTLGLIVTTIEYLKNQFETLFYIMTATMPLKLKMLLQKTLCLTDQNVIQDSELLNEARNHFQVRENMADDLYDEIGEAIKRYKKVLIVVNTVDEAIRLYNVYKEMAEYAICFHSRFIQKDRFDKEQDILKREKANLPMLLIATQVVEVSLDIDFDILFTENAPIDAIIQRAGRINRKNKKGGSKVIIFQHQSVTEEFIYNEVGILSKTFEVLLRENGKKLTEHNLNKLVDEVYENFDIENHASFKEGKKAYQEVQKGLHFIKDNTEQDKVFTREGLDSINVIPAKFEEELQDKSAEEKTKYELSIRRTKKYSAKHYHDKKHNWFTYIDVEYDTETGLKFKSKEDKEHSRFF